MNSYNWDFKLILIICFQYTWTLKTTLHNGCLLTFAFVMLESTGVDSQSIRTSVKNSPQSAKTIYTTHASIHFILFTCQATIHHKSLPHTLSLILLSHHLSIGTSQRKILNSSNLQPQKSCWQITNRRSKGKVQFDIFTFHKWMKVFDSGKGQKIRAVCWLIPYLKLT